MNTKTLVFVLAAIMSNIVKENVYVTYASMGSSDNTWLGTGAFSVGVALVLSSLVKISANEEETPAPIMLFTYYTAMSALVSVLALKLIWVPVVDLLSELNMILSKMVLYLSKSIFPRKRDNCVKQLGLFLGTKDALVWSANLIGLIFLYAVSSNIRHYLGMYLNNIQTRMTISRLKMTIVHNATMLFEKIKRKFGLQWRENVPYQIHKTGPLCRRHQYIKHFK